MMVIACTYGDDGGYNATRHCIRAEVACCNCEATEPACWTHSLLVCLHLLVHTLYTTSGKVRPILHHSSQQYTAPQWSSKRLAAVTSGSWLLHTLTTTKVHNGCLQAAAQPQHQVQRALLLDVVVGQSATVLQLLAGKDQALLVRRDACRQARTSRTAAGLHRAQYNACLLTITQATAARQVPQLRYNTPNHLQLVEQVINTYSRFAV